MGARVDGWSRAASTPSVSGPGHGRTERGVVEQASDLLVGPVAVVAMTVC